jgi:hypothetical protein
VGAEPGLILPTLAKYEDLVIFLKRHCPEKADADFAKGFIVLFKDCSQYSVVAYQFYHWLAYQAGLPGYDPMAQKLYDIFNKRYNSQLNPKFLDSLGLQETGLLKAAIRRDREALQFTREVLRDIVIPANNAKLLDKGQAQA